MGLTHEARPRLAAGVLALGAVLAPVVYAMRSAESTSRARLESSLNEARETLSAILSDRAHGLRTGVEVLAADPAFMAAIATDRATVYGMLQERGQALEADFLLATDPRGRLVARTDRPAAGDDDLSRDAVVRRAFEDGESSGVWRQGSGLFQVVGVSMRFGQDVVGVLAAGYRLDQAAAERLGTLVHCRVLLEEQRREPGEGFFEMERSLGLRVPLRPSSGGGEGALLLVKPLDERSPLAGVGLALVTAASVGLALAAVWLASRPAR